MAHLLKAIKQARAGKPVVADIFWTVLHSSSQPTSWQTLHELRECRVAAERSSDRPLRQKAAYHAGKVHVRSSALRRRLTTCTPSVPLRTCAFMRTVVN